MILLRKSPLHIGSSSQHDHIVNRHLGIGNRLGDKGNALGNLVVAHLQNALPVQKQLPGVRLQNFVQTLQQRAFPHAVVS